MSSLNAANATSVLSLLVNQIEAMIPALEESESPLLLARIKRNYGQFDSLRAATQLVLADVLEAAHDLRSTLAEMVLPEGDLPAPVQQLLALWHGLSSQLSVEAR